MPCDVDGVPVLVEVVGEVRARPPGSGGEDPDGDDVDLGATDITGGSAEEAAP
ncbi:MAG: hypothetical protein ACR2MO_04760 [Acidimicrobiales bacterium]